VWTALEKVNLEDRKRDVRVILRLIIGNYVDCSLLSEQNWPTAQE
jgi:hypothetical protein